MKEQSISKNVCVKPVDDIRSVKRIDGLCFSPSSERITEYHLKSFLKHKSLVDIMLETLPPLVENP